MNVILTMVAAGMNVLTVLAPLNAPVLMDMRLISMISLPV